MKDNELAHQAAKTLEALSLDMNISKLVKGLEVEKPTLEITLMRLSAIKSRLLRGLEITMTLEALLRGVTKDK